MEANPASKQASSGIRNSLVSLLLLGGAVGALWFYGRLVPMKPLEQSLQAIASSIDLEVKLVDADDQPVEKSIFAIDDSKRKSAETAQPENKTANKTTENTAHETLEVTSRRVALSVYPSDGKRVLAWLSDNPESTYLLSSPLFQGMLQPLFDTLNISAEDYALEGVKGQFLRTILREIVTAESRLDYDPEEGARGIILSFRRDSAPLTGRILPVLLDRIVRRQWNVSGLSSPIWEAILGKQKLFVHESQGVVFLSRSLRGLLNVLQEQLTIGQSSNGSDSVDSAGANATSLRFVLRTDALVDKLLPLLVGRDASLRQGSVWPVELALSLDGASPANARIKLPGARVFSLFRTQIEPAVLSSVPADSAAFLATSVQLPAGLTADAWNKLALSGEFASNPPTSSVADSAAAPTARGGLAIVWDLNQSKNGLSEVGIALTAPLPSQAGDLVLTDYAKDPSLASTCANGSVWLLSSTANLLTRMREACDGTSISINNQNRFADRLNGNSQIIAGLQFEAALEQVFKAGLPDLEPSNPSVKEASWKSDYRAAVQNLKQTIDQQLSGVSPVYFAGTVDPIKGATLEGFSR